MEYTFTRKFTMTGSLEGQDCIREWNRINAKLRKNLDRIIEKKCTEAELASYIRAC